MFYAQGSPAASPELLLNADKFIRMVQKPDRLPLSLTSEYKDEKEFVILPYQERGIAITEIKG